MSLPAPTQLPTVSPSLVNPRSMGLKLLLICGLALAMMLPAFLIEGLLTDRTARARQVLSEVSAQMGGAQTFLGPTLAIPYHLPSLNPPTYTQQGLYLVFPTAGTAHVHLLTEERRKSLFRVPIFKADLQMDGAFDLQGSPRDLPEGAELEWDRAELVVGISDLRGALEDATLETDAGRSALGIASVCQTLTLGPQGGSPGLKLSLLGSRVTNIGAGSRFSAHSVLHFSGAQRLAVLAYAQATHLAVDGNWPNPGFGGEFLPTTYQSSKHGFKATWFVPFTARGVHAEGSEQAFTGLGRTALSVTLVEVADPYQSVDRSLKYAPLVLGLVFVSYFVFELTAGRRLHPAQYLLVGIAQMVFYLLLLSTAERVGFGLGFLLAGTATVLLLAKNAAWVFRSARQGYRALCTFSLLYGLIYLLLRLEDNALLIGSAASFLAIAALMYFTRSLDWYNSASELSPIEASGLTTAPHIPNAAI